MSEHYDVIVIGTGAGGGTLARHLAPSGKRILLLERGDWLPREPSNLSTTDVFVDGRYISEDSWYDVKGKSFPASPRIAAASGSGPGSRRPRLQARSRDLFQPLFQPWNLRPRWA